MEKETALKILKELHDKSLFAERTALETLIPELKESENERIRKENIEWFKTTVQGSYAGYPMSIILDWVERQGVKVSTIDMSIKEKAHQIAWETSKHYDPLLSKESWCEMAALDMASWLEKQGKHDNFLNKIQIGDKVTRNEDGVLVNLSQLNRVAKKDEKHGEQKPVWSEEDLISLGYLAAFVDANGDSFYGKNKPNVVKWIRSFANLNPTKKQEWSEEDKEHIRSIISTIECSKAQFPNSPAVVDAYESDLVWLKSIKERYAWKPSKEQMEILQYLCETSSHPNEKVIPTLMSLYQDLKKLREE